MIDMEDVKEIIKNVALQNGVSEEVVREEIKNSIHEAFLEKTPAFAETFGDHEPTLEEFIEKMAEQIGSAFSQGR